MAILRSQYAHATLESVDVDQAENRDDVVAVFTGADVEESGIQTTSRLPGRCPDSSPQYRIIATDKVRHTGDAIAAVVAEDRYAAHNALGDIDVTYDRLDAVTEPDEAVDSDVTVHGRHRTTSRSISRSATRTPFRRRFRPPIT